ncbi:hypothetical protein TL16_g04901 [Triparma laevis f. inornata]|uniref:Ribosomal eL28/Mak16 domain-containing protein n=2 Tax=Triparma laevis TaxID=1534972 RepID=A0A9W7AIF8_9STRA|nr:hypothetical protein TL16_g04901 [Triparma laevis f. inornata]GMH69758.1 hypothetical protein TrLO_g11272 [Triparma laevis f. longispina]
MVAISDSLTWQLISQNNSFLHKKNGRSSRTGAIRFSKEKANVMSLSTFKYSGIANSRATSVTVAEDSKGNTFPVLVKKTSKGKTVTIPLNKNFRSAVKTVTSQNNRADLTANLKAKYAGIYNGNMAKKEMRKKTVVKVGRNGGI